MLVLFASLAVSQSLGIKGKTCHTRSFTPRIQSLSIDIDGYATRAVAVAKAIWLEERFCGGLKDRAGCVVD